MTEPNAFENAAAYIAIWFVGFGIWLSCQLHAVTVKASGNMSDKYQFLADAMESEKHWYIRDCVNACAGIDDPETTVPELVEYLRGYCDKYGLVEGARELLDKCAGVPE